jgi:hypothetical protein
MLAVSWAFLLYLAIQKPLIGVPLLLLPLVVRLVVPSRPPTKAPVGTREEIAGLRVRLPTDERSSWFHPYEVIQSLTPWDQIESVGVGAPALSLSRVRVRSTDGREADLPASAVTRWGLRKIANTLERLRPEAG